MAQGAMEERWNHTAILRAEIRAPWSKKQIDAAQLHPFAKRRRKRKPVKPHPQGVAMLTAALCGDHSWARK